MYKQKINIKPLSVNQAWQGRRYKTKLYKSYETELLMRLKKKEIPKEAHLSISIEYGFSNRASDIDNPTKLVLDILQKRLGFNDSKIYYLEQKKVIVKKGLEYIDIQIDSIKE